MKIEFMGIELDLKYDLTEANDSEKLEEVVSKYMKKITDLEAKTDMKHSALIREEVKAAKEMLDTVFGANSAKKVFDGRENLKTVCAITYFIQGITRIYVPGILSESLKQDIKKYSPERALRLV